MTNWAKRNFPLRHRRLIGLMLSCSALIAFPTHGVAQQADDDVSGEEESYRLAPIIVNSNGEADDDANSIVATELWVGGKVATSILDTPASVSVITEKEIQDRNAQTVEEVLDYTAGVVTDYFGSDDRNDYYLVRGFQASTYRDGLTLGTMRGVREEPYAFERVEVLKGANSTLFGPSDPGGAVNFVTKLPRFERFGEVYLQGGSFSTGELGFDFGGPVSENSNLAYRFTGKLQNGELEYDYSNDDEVFLMGGLTWAPTDYTTLSVVYDFLKRDSTPNSGGYPLDRLYDRSLFFGEPDFNSHEVDRNTVSALLEHEFDNGLSLQANLRYSDLSDDFGYIYLFDYVGRTGTILDRFNFGSDESAQETIGNVILQYDTGFGPVDSNTLFGLEYRDASVSTSSYYGVADPIDIADPVYSGAPAVLAPYSEQQNDSTTKSMFLQQNLSFYDRLIATVGVRQDWMDVSSAGYNLFSVPAVFDDSASYSETSYRAALTYKVTDEVSAYVSYVQSVAPPTVGVEPERGDQYEIGVKYQPYDIDAIISVALFDLTKKNITVPVVLPSGVIERQLVGENRVRGFEIEGKAELADNLSVIAAYSYLDSKVVRSAPIRGVDVEGNQLASTPKNMASVWLSYLVPGSGRRGDMNFAVGARYIGPYFFNIQNNSGKSKATTLFDAAFTYDVTDNMQFALNVSNVFDNQHVVGRGTADYYNPGRTIAATLRRTW